MDLFLNIKVQGFPAVQVGFFSIKLEVKIETPLGILSLHKTPLPSSH